MSPRLHIPRFWLGASLLGGLLSVLYGFELAKGVYLIFSHERVSAEVVHRQEDGGFFEVGYRFQEGAQSVYRERRYRFPETLFLAEMGEGERVQLIRGPAGEMPVPLVRFEIFSSLAFLLLALALLVRSSRELRGQASGKPVSH